MARQLRHLLREAKTTLGTAALAENWVFSPQKGLHGITPAEAIQYEGYAHVVRTLLNSDASRDREETWSERSDRPMRVAIDAEAAPVIPMPAVSAVKAIAGRGR